MHDAHNLGLTMSRGNVSFNKETRSGDGDVCAAFRPFDRGASRLASSSAVSWEQALSFVS